MDISITPQAVTQPRAMSRAKVIFAVTLGNGMEFFDFTVYSFFAVLIGKLFFPVHDPLGQLLLSVGTFGAGFITRPLGGVMLGAYADRAGRKAAMTLTIFLMALSTGLIGLTPTYAQIGLAAPALIVLARLLQGFSAGGEVGASTTLLVEYASARTRGFYGSWQLASQGAAALFGALLATLLSAALPVESLESWGWRLPFLLGILVAPLGAFIRRRLGETHTPRAAEAPHGSVREVLGRHRTITLLGIVLTVGGTVANYIVLFYIPTYAIRILGMSMKVAMLAGVMAGLITFVSSPLFGAWSDRWGRKPLILWSRLAIIALIYPAFWLLHGWPSVGMLLAVVAVMSLLNAMSGVPTIVIMPELFPKAVRATGMAIVYSVGVALFGGFAQFIVTWLIKVTGDPLSPSWYVIGCGAASLLALWPIREFAGRELD
ncbi:major facilitator transporter [Pandoraea thiooxydans]|uniref:MFS transporter n=1 Tax=Pandoraea thiooxydans TaxID=445709 RepID=A0A0G3EW20_9BURK|nr:MFS transporter [Pandoraea thiooxydans]AKJ68906.1 MFS transporter [Pandoraea thiooxydans]APR96420.1 major facilitator transporter [Pandoraea thiooxydans]